MSDQLQQPIGTGTLNDPEPAPVKNGNIEIWPLIIQELMEQKNLAGTLDLIVTNALISDARERHAQGIAKYGVGLQPFNGRDALKDAYQESLDMLAYTRQLYWENACNDENLGACIELMSIAQSSAMAYRAVIYARDGK